MLQPYVKTFLAVAKSGSFSAAAEVLYISKVSVMNQMNALERDAGVKLWERTSRGAVLTEAGQKMAEYAEKLNALADAAMRETREAGGLPAQTIRIGASMMRPSARLVELWDSIGGPKPEIQFDIVPFSDGRNGLFAMLKALGDTIDCFATPGGTTKLLMEYGFLPFGQCQCHVAMSKKHPLAKKKILRWEDLEGETLMLLKRGDSYVLDALRDEALRSHPSIRIIDFDGFYDISAFNLAIRKQYIMETLDLWENLHPSMVTLPVRWNYEMPYGIVYAKEPSGIVGTFLASIRKHISR
ncbi:MAG: LysR family transcriptional regulator [Schwartzia sp.]|nr:LysR family transcriptional regulator [Schwartzia sp. (in: firmicutes)]